MLVIGERIDHRALVAVVGGELEDEVEIAGEPLERRVVGDRALNQRDGADRSGMFSRSLESRLSTTTICSGACCEQRADEVRADEAGSSDDQDPRA